MQIEFFLPVDLSYAFRRFKPKNSLSPADLLASSKQEYHCQPQIDELFEDRDTVLIGVFSCQTKTREKQQRGGEEGRRAHNLKIMIFWNQGANKIVPHGKNAIREGNISRESYIDRWLKQNTALLHDENIPDGPKCRACR